MKLYQTLQDDNKAKIKVAYTFKPTRPTKEVSFIPFNIPKTRKQASLKGQLSKKAFFNVNFPTHFAIIETLQLRLSPTAKTAMSYII